MRQTTGLFLVASAAMLLIGGCKPADPPGEPAREFKQVAPLEVTQAVPTVSEPTRIEHASKQIGVEGGELELPKVSFSVPPGALDASIQVILSETDLVPVPGVVALSPVYRCEPTEQTFQQPIRVSMRFDWPRADEVKVLWSGHDGQPAELLSGTVEGNVFTVTRDHCSVFELVVTGVKIYEEVEKLKEGHKDNCRSEACCPSNHTACADNPNSCCPTGSACYGTDRCIKCPAGSFMKDGQCWEAVCLNGTTSCGEACCQQGSFCSENKCYACPEGTTRCGTSLYCCTSNSTCVDNYCAPNDVNECLTNNGGCDPVTTCTDTKTSRTCGPCPSGYTGTNATGCTDINECQTNNGGCDALTTCTNTPGSRTCGTCPSGYTGTGATSCTDINECQTNNGGCDALTTCTNTPGSRTCSTCPSGYTGSSATGCSDTNECQTNNGGCDALTTCTNTPGSWTCGACPGGYSGAGATGCSDINECQTSNGGCDALTTCTNTPGSRTCGACPSGYTGTGATGCSDINECQTSNGGCDALTTCTNTPGSRTCGACPSGYDGTGATGCTPATYSLGGTVSGLNGTVVLRNGSDQASVSVSGSFTFQQRVTYGAAYSVTVHSQPSGQTCSVSGGSGTMGAGNVSSVLVTCQNNLYFVSGAVNGLYGSIELKLNGGNPHTLNATAGESVPFTFTEKVAFSSAYNVTISTAPVTRICSVASGTGTMGAGDVTNVVVNCVDPTTAKRVFVTAATFNGALGGLAGADSRCQQAAQTAGITGTFRAWISGNDLNGSTKSISRLSHSTGTYYKLDGANNVTVANNFDDFFVLKGADYLRSPIDRDENGAAVTGTVFTGTEPNGSFSSTGQHCSLWSAATTGVFGVVGTVGQSNSGWTQAGSANCSNTNHLYCFEQ